VLVDVSGSMERYARLLLAFLHAATRSVHGTAWARRVCLRHPPDRPDARLPAGRHRRHAGCRQPAPSSDFAGGTRLGDALATLRQHHARRLVGRRTLVLVISDGLDTGEPDDAGARTGWLRRRSRRLLWLNPLLRFDGYAPRRAARPCCTRPRMACWRCTTSAN
jgi:uncharacterized protein with von Willebrand factor type A (vWA) domain